MSVRWSHRYRLDQTTWDQINAIKGTPDKTRGTRKGNYDRKWWLHRKEELVSNSTNQNQALSNWYSLMLKLFCHWKVGQAIAHADLPLVLVTQRRARKEA